MIELSRKDITRLLEWWYVVQRERADTLEDYDLAERLQLAEQRAYEQERTR